MRHESNLLEYVNAKRVSKGTFLIRTFTVAKLLLLGYIIRDFALVSYQISMHSSAIGSSAIYREMMFRFYFEVLFLGMLLSYDYWFQKGISIPWFLVHCVDTITLCCIACILGLLPLPSFLSISDVILIPNIGNLLHCALIMVEFIYKSYIFPTAILLTIILVNSDWDTIHKVVSINASWITRTTIGAMKRENLGLYVMCLLFILYVVNELTGTQDNGENAFLLLIFSFTAFTEYHHPSTASQLFQKTLLLRKYVTPYFTSSGPGTEYDLMYPDVLKIAPILILIVVLSSRGEDILINPLACKFFMESCRRNILLNHPLFYYFLLSSFLIPLTLNWIVDAYASLLHFLSRNTIIFFSMRYTTSGLLILCVPYLVIASGMFEEIVSSVQFLLPLIFQVIMFVKGLKVYKVVAY